MTPKQALAQFFYAQMVDYFEDADFPRAAYLFGYLQVLRDQDSTLEFSEWELYHETLRKLGVRIISGLPK